MNPNQSGLSVVDVTSFFSFSASGGIRTYLTEKSRVLGERGIRHTIVVPDAESGVDPWFDSTLVRVKSPQVVFAPAYRQLVDYGAIRQALSDARPSVVEVGSPFTVPSLVRWATKGQGIPTVGFYHSDLVRTYAEPFVDRRILSPLRVGLRMTARRMIRSIYTRFDATVCASPGLVKELRTLGVPRVREIPLGVDLDLFRPLDPPPEPLVPRTDRPVGVYVGRLCPEKRLDVLLDGYQRLAADERPHLVLVGDGNIRESLMQRAAHIEGVHFRPYVSDREELVRIYNGADFYVAPGPGETFGLSIAEALASGLPVLCVRRGAGPERLAGSGVGVLYRHGDPDSVASAFRDMVTRVGPQARKDARAHAERTLAWRVTFDRLLSLYEELQQTRESWHAA